MPILYMITLFLYMITPLLCARNAHAVEAVAADVSPSFNRIVEPCRQDAPGADPARGRVTPSPQGQAAEGQLAWEQEVYRLDLPALMADKTLSTNGAEMRYRLYVPPDIDVTRPVPLVLYLHHAGQRANDNAGNKDNLRQLRNDYGSSDLGTGAFVHPESQHRHPCVVVAPQILHEDRWGWASGVDWSKPRSDMAKSMGRSMAAAFAVLDRTIADLPIDRSRIYVTGTSMGGAGSFEAVARRPQFFAGALIICGAHDDGKGDLFRSTPMRLFHGTTDTIIHVERTRQMVDAIRAAGGQVDYTEYSDLQHMNCRDVVYAAPAVIDWLFSQRRSVEGDAGASPR